jgi:hypothetical protein
MSNATRISDLPDHMGQQQQMMGSMGGDANTYMPMNVHPNPYGNGAGPNVQAGPPPPIHDFREPRNGGDRGSGGGDRDRSIANNSGGGGGGYDLGMSGGQEQYIPPQQQRLPSRDIPMDTTLYAQDEDIQVNRLPKPPKTVRIRDYVDEYIESDAVDRIENHEREKRRSTLMEHTWMDIQIPILVALLYMVFQQNALHRILFRYAQTLGIYSGDGTLNMYGIMFKGALFGSVYAMMMKTIQLVL